MRILLTGATGKVGSRAASRIAGQHDVRLLLRQANHAAEWQARGFAVVLGDLTQPDTLVRAVENIDAIVHLAACVRGATADRIDAVNHRGAIALARVGLPADVTRFVFASSALVYADLDRAATERDPVRASFPYAATKLEAEQGLRDCEREGGLDLRVLRLAFVYGDGDSHLDDWLPRLRTRRGSARFQLVHHADVAKAIELALGDTRSGTYNVADDDPLQIRDIQQLLGESLSRDDAEDASSDWTGVMDTTRIRTELGFRPTFGSLRDAIARRAL